MSARPALVRLWIARGVGPLPARGYHCPQSDVAMVPADEVDAVIESLLGDVDADVQADATYYYRDRETADADEDGTSCLAIAAEEGK